MQDILEGQIRQHLETFHIPPDYRERILAMRRSLERTDDAGQRRKSLESQLARLQKLYEWGDLEEADYLAQRAGIREELETLRPAARTEEPLDRLRDFLASVASAWRAASPEHRNRLAKALYQEIWVNEKAVVSVRPRPEFEPFFPLAC